MQQSQKSIFIGERSLPVQMSWQWVALISFVLMQMSWATPWIQSVNSSLADVHPGVMVTVASILVLITNASMRLVTALALNRSVRRLIAGIVLIVDLFLGLNLMTTNPNQGSLRTLGSQQMETFGDFLNAIPAWFWVTIIVLSLWWYGMRLSRERIGPFMVFNNFRIGIIMFALFALAGFLVPMAAAIEPTGLLFLFLLTGLISLVTSRVSILGYLRGGGKSPFDRRWLLAISISAFGFVLLAYGAAAVLTGQAASFYGLISGLLIGIGVVLAAPILLVLYLISPAVEQLQEALPTPVVTEALGDQEGIGGITPSGSDYGFLSWGEAFTLSPEMRSILVVVGLVVLIVILILSFRWISQGSEKGDEDIQRDDLSGDKNLLELVQELFRRQLQEAADRVQTGGRMSEQERRIVAERIRVIYSKLMELAGDSGFPRADSETPLEYQKELSYAFPACVEDVSTITQAYIKVRYGEVPETKDQVDLIEQAWEKIKVEVQRAAQATG